MVRPRVGDLLVQHAARRTGQPGRQRQPERADRARARAHDGQRPAVQRLAPAHRRATGCSSAATLYFEGLTSVAFDVNPTTGAETAAAAARAGRRHLQAGRRLRPDHDRRRPRQARRDRRAARRLQLVQRAARRTRPIVNGQPLWPDDSLSDDERRRSGSARRIAPTPDLTLIAALAHAAIARRT